MATGSTVSMLARAIKRSNTSTPAWLPRAPQLSLHQGTLSAVDVPAGSVDFLFPDPSGLVLPQVRFMQPYTDSNVPEVGHVVWGLHYGTDFMVIGQHVSAGGVLIP